MGEGRKIINSNQHMTRKRKKKQSHSFFVQRQKRRSQKILRRRRRKIHKYIPIESIVRQSEDQYGSDVLNRLFPGYKHIFSPALFSFIDNKDETLEFLEGLRHCLNRKKKTLVRLDNVNRMSTDAVLVLLSIMVQFKTSRVEFNGTKPKDMRCRNKLAMSGFFEYLYNNRSVPKNQYSFRKLANALFTHGQKTVASELADKIVKSASEFVWGEPRRCQGVQKTLLELMHNTFDHAGTTKGDKHWWLSVEQDDDLHEVTISFIDFGVGIFRSLQNKGTNEPLYGALQWLIKNFPLAQSQPEKLKLILEGKLQLTQSNEYFRGKGLAKIYNHYQSYRIASLCIISNYAYYNADKQEYSNLNNEFLGTFISFKIKNNIISLPWQI